MSIMQTNILYTMSFNYFTYRQVDYNVSYFYNLQ